MNPWNTSVCEKRGFDTVQFTFRARKLLRFTIEAAAQGGFAEAEQQHVLLNPSNELSKTPPYLSIDDCVDRHLLTQGRNFV